MKYLTSISYLFFLRYYMLLAWVARYFPKNKTKIENSLYFFSSFFPENAGYHWRVHKWAEVLEKNGFFVKIGIATTEKEFYSTHENESTKFQKKYLKKRFLQVLESRNYEVVIVRRELLLFNDYGDLFLLKLLLQFHPNAILDFDDDLTASKEQPKAVTHLFGKLMAENGDSFNDTIKKHVYFIPGTHYLKEIVLSQNPNLRETNVCVIPTCVDYEKYEAKIYDPTKSTIVLGWIGSDGNYPLLDSILGDLDRIAEEYNIELVVIGGKEYARKTNFPISFYQWDLHTEIDNLKKIDLGLMPLDKSKVSDGKAGFKLIQYMALGIVPAGSAVTINKEIIANPSQGYLVEDNWYVELKKALNNFKDFESIGKNAREQVLNNYTFSANEKKYIAFIREVQKKSRL